MPEAPGEMVLVYDAHRAACQTAFTQGRIARLYYLPYEGERMFEIEDGEQRSSWPRLGDESWFVVGWHARVEHTTGSSPEVVKIWIGGEA